MASDHRGKPLHAGKRTADEQYKQHMESMGDFQDFGPPSMATKVHDPLKRYNEDTPPDRSARTEEQRSLDPDNGPRPGYMSDPKYPDLEKLRKF